ncbi:winged helix-turn-helix transcriptional regulator [Virgibacillus sp. NKC19-16]|uniref:ArsR/SmtB family transcription factor n=1 Tax=Virgibacillus salidurans TaxID=2831673 RepID=UPI001F29DC28|nr:winged helix-turn-helix domain-containing protein [Virgibacillus sp. NKC19-16]UJL46078.1 winged helix-turn-helix transcriptional regulator [Virgibacillus sp. NKC19-16]
MDILSATSRERETYQVELQYSVLWEAALGIAAFTNTSLLDSLERPKSYWDEIRDSFDREMHDHLDYVEKNNTWKALLQLLHQKDFAALEEFSTYIETLSVNDLKFICIPFVGESFQTLRERAAEGEMKAIQTLKEQTKNNPFFPDYIDFICNCEGNELEDHLIRVMTGWYEKVIQPNEDQLNKILQTDVETKAKMKEKMKPEEFVEWATAGVVYTPEPSVHKVLLIPHYIYRPWNITADIDNTKVFYYPISNESVSPEDKYLPSNFLVLKHKALGDEVRMRIVKLLYERSRTLQDITEQLGMGKSTIHHHLKLLRSAQLVNVEDSKYVLKKKAIDSLAKEMDLYFHQGM